MRSLIFNQGKDLRIGVIREYLEVEVMARAAEFKIDCSLSSRVLGRLRKREFVI